MAHDHNHEINYNRAFALGIGLNVFFVVLEAAYGFYADSLALIADAGHNLSDVISLLLAWGATLLAKKSATETRTYGYRKVTVMASLISAILLLVALGSIAREAVSRLFDPQPVAGMVVMVVAGVGVVINTATALLFVSGQKEDLNIRGAFLHMAADAVVSLGVVLAGAIILWTGWLWIDPAISLAVVVVIVIGTWGLLRDSLNLALDAVPASINLPAIQAYLDSFDEVVRTHDLHVWALSTTQIALTVHLVVKDEAYGTLDPHAIEQHLHDHFGIDHSTIQVEKRSSDQYCRLNSEKCR